MSKTGQSWGLAWELCFQAEAPCSVLSAGHLDACGLDSGCPPGPLCLPRLLQPPPPTQQLSTSLLRDTPGPWPFHLILSASAVLTGTGLLLRVPSGAAGLCPRLHYREPCCPQSGAGKDLEQRCLPGHQAVPLRGQPCWPLGPAYVRGAAWCGVTWRMEGPCARTWLWGNRLQPQLPSPSWGERRRVARPQDHGGGGVERSSASLGFGRKILRSSTCRPGSRILSWVPQLTQLPVPRSYHLWARRDCCLRDLRGVVTHPGAVVSLGSVVVHADGRLHSDRVSVSRQL